MHKTRSYSPRLSLLVEKDISAVHMASDTERSEASFAFGSRSRTCRTSDCIISMFALRTRVKIHFRMFLAENRSPAELTFDPPSLPLA